MAVTPRSRLTSVEKGSGEVKILHMSAYQPWGPEMVDAAGKVSGGHHVCVFKIIGEDIHSYYMLDVESNLARKFDSNDRSAVMRYVLKPENLKRATHLDTVKVAA
jgi:hypothetical protein